VSKGASLNSADCNGDSPLHIAASLGHDKAVRAIVDKADGKALIRRNKKGRTAYAEAIMTLTGTLTATAAAAAAASAACRASMVMPAQCPCWHFCTG
jgi:hypothetical protein